MHRAVHAAAALGLAAALHPGAHAQDARPLWGDWRLEDASIPLPADCRRIAYSFKPDGAAEGTDGVAVIVSRYRADAAEAGLLVHWTYLSDNGRPGCQGISAEARRKTAIPTSLVVFQGDNQIRMHLGDTREAPYLVLVRGK